MSQTMIDLSKKPISLTDLYQSEVRSKLHKNSDGKKVQFTCRLTPKAPDTPKANLTARSHVSMPQTLRSSIRSNTVKQMAKKPLLKQSKSMKSFKIAESLNIFSRHSANQETESQYRKHLGQVFRSLKFIKMLPIADSLELRQKRVTLPKRPGYENCKTIIFDMDETLIHCVEQTDEADVVIPIEMPAGQVVLTGIRVRPYARECLAEAQKYFEVIVFTAGVKCYADAILNYLDPQNTLIHHRLYRDHCVEHAGSFVKDLRILVGRKFQDMVIVDNAMHSFGYQMDNGVPIVSWYQDENDRELQHLMEYFPELLQAQDMREVNRLTFNIGKFYSDYSSHVNGNLDNL